MRRLLTASLASLAGAAAAANAPPPPETLKLPPGWQLVWSDEFDVDGLPDPKKWGYDTTFNQKGWFNHEQQYYSGPRAENAVVRDGRLVITARKETRSAAIDWGGQRYTSARLFTRGLAEWTTGFFEIRARLPCGLGTLNRERGRFARRNIASTSSPIRRRRSNKASGMGTRSAMAPPGVCSMESSSLASPALI